MNGGKKEVKKDIEKERVGEREREREREEGGDYFLGNEPSSLTAVNIKKTQIT